MVKPPLRQQFLTRYGLPWSTTSGSVSMLHCLISFIIDFELDHVTMLLFNWVRMYDYALVDLLRIKAMLDGKSQK